MDISLPFACKCEFFLLFYIFACMTSILNNSASFGVWSSNVECGVLLYLYYYTYLRLCPTHRSTLVFPFSRNTFVRMVLSVRARPPAESEMMTLNPVLYFLTSYSSNNRFKAAVVFSNAFYFIG